MDANTLELLIYFQEHLYEYANEDDIYWNYRNGPIRLIKADLHATNQTLKTLIKGVK